jgi:hypothetical protein
MTKLLVIGDTHLPFINWDVVAGCADYAKWYKPDLIIQVGDLIDSYNWSLFKRAPDSPSAACEWDMTVHAVNRFRDYFPRRIPWKILEGNHCRRYMLRAAEVNLPKQLIKTLDFVFQFDNWHWHMKPEPLVIEDIAFLHGDEMPGNAWQKAQRMGMSVVQGHDHQGYLQYVNTFKHSIFGMSVGTMIDADSIVGRYSAKNAMKCWYGWSKIEHGMPQLIQYR